MKGTVFLITPFSGVMLVGVTFKDKDLLPWSLEISIQLLLLYYGNETSDNYMEHSNVYCGFISYTRTV